LLEFRSERELPSPPANQPPHQTHLHIESEPDPQEWLTYIERLGAGAPTPGATGLLLDY